MTSTPRFELGQTVATPGAINTFVNHGITPASLLDRHVSGDWGDVDRADARENELSVKEGYRILSSYGEGDARLWVITEADRSSTCILRPEEY